MKHPSCRCDICPLQARGFRDVERKPEEPSLILILPHEPRTKKDLQLIRSCIPTGALPDTKSIAILTASFCGMDQRVDATAVQRGIAIKACIGHVIDYLDTHTKAPVVVFGQETWHALGYSGDITSVEGVPQYRNGRRIYPTFHPSFVLANPPAYHAMRATITNACYPDAPDMKAQFMVVSDVAEVEKYFVSGREYVVDIETTGFDPYNDDILLVAISLDASRAFIFPEPLLRDPTQAAALRNLLHRDCRWVFHNGKFDVRFLRNHTTLRVTPVIAEDTMLLHYTLDERRGTHGLKELCQRMLGIPDYEAQLHATLPSKKSSYRLAPTKVLQAYAAKDVCFTLRLLGRLRRQLEHDPLAPGIIKAYYFLVQSENDLVPIEDNGIFIDVAQAQALQVEFQALCDSLEGRMKEITRDPNFNPRSPKQVGAFMYDVMKVPTVRLFRKQIDRSTNAETVEKLKALYPDNEFLQVLSRYRSIHKILSTYVGPMVDMRNPDGRLRTTFMLHGTVTGRLASQEPNLMNIPRSTKNEWAGRIRHMVVAAPGHQLINCDFSQAEMRVLAQLSRDPFLVDTYAAGRDLHTETTIMLFGEGWKKEDRMIAKMLNFGLVYGRTAHSISTERGIPLAQAQGLMDRFFERMPFVSSWIDGIREQAINQGFLQLPTGRVRRFGLVTDKNRFPVSTEASNFPPSSISSDICLTAFRAIHHYLEQTGQGRALLMVHDSIIVEAKDDYVEIVTDMLQRCMREAAIEILGPDSVPFEVDASVGRSWGEL